MRCWKYALLALAVGVPLHAFAFLGMNASATLQGPLPAWTKQLGAKGAPKQTFAQSVATDSSGNAYVAGHTDGGFDGNTLTGTQDYILTKYDSSGAKVWTLQRGIASKDIEANGVATDSSGNVIIAGYTDGGLDGNTQTGIDDFFVVKYDSTGARLWTRQLGVASQYTYGHSVATDPAGNIFVAGSTTGGLDGNALSGTFDTDFYVTKYDAAGTKLWTRQLGVSGNFTYGMAAAADSSGNVMVAGYTTGGLDGNTRSGGTYDFFVTKYDSSGTKLWTRQLGAAGASTYCFGLTTDSSGNAFVTGNIDGGLDGNTLTGSTDVYVTKYDPSGTKLWTRQLGAASQNTSGNGVTTDSSGNVFVGGYTTGGLDGNTLSGTQDFYVTKFNSAGTKLWTKQLGVVSRITRATGVATDLSGNAIVTGTTQGDLDGNTLTGSKDLFITKYSSAGSKLWTRQNGAVTGTGGSVGAAFAATDASANVYVAGYTDTGLDGNTQTGTQDFFVTKYNSAGARLWTRQLGVASHETEANGVATDPSGNIYVAGYTEGGLDGNTLTGLDDFFVTKYDPTGTKLWTKQMGVASQYTYSYAVATDLSGNVFVAGDTSGGLDGNSLSGTDNVDLFVTKYDSSGAKLWTKQLGASQSPFYHVYTSAVSTDSSGNVFVSGFTDTSFDGQTQVGTSDMFVTKLDPAGNKQWTRQLGAPSKSTTLTAAAADASGNILATGYTAGNFDGHIKIGNRDLFVAKFDSAGNKQWTRQMGIAAMSTWSYAVAVDPSENIFLTGSTAGAFDGNIKRGTLDFYVTKYTSAGLLQWTKQFGSAGKSTSASGVAIDSFGHLYVTGTTTGGLDNNTQAGTWDLFISQYIGN